MGNRMQYIKHRFIPACAGNMERWRWSIGPSTVHPRVCGEHIQRKFNTLAISGSSPRVRGTFSILPSYTIWHRFIPACAGNICEGKRTFRQNPVHPRVCGEHVKARARNGLYSGSSPRVRGTFNFNPLRKRAHRFIPACAGNISALTPGIRAIPVHPRVCGEHLQQGINARLRCGSSPRVRGT